MIEFTIFLWPLPPFPLVVGSSVAISTRTSIIGQPNAKPIGYQASQVLWPLTCNRDYPVLRGIVVEWVFPYQDISVLGMRLSQGNDIKDYQCSMTDLAMNEAMPRRDPDTDV